jgi:hypothetical protein
MVVRQYYACQRGFGPGAAVANFRQIGRRHPPSGVDWFATVESRNRDWDYDRIMVSNILNCLMAFKACGSLAGMTMISPGLR